MFIVCFDAYPLLVEGEGLLIYKWYMGLAAGHARGMCGHLMIQRQGASHLEQGGNDVVLLPNMEGHYTHTRHILL